MDAVSETARTVRVGPLGMRVDIPASGVDCMRREQIVWAQLSKADQQKIRKEMLVQAENLLKGMYASKAQLKSAARTMADKALAKERLRS